MLKNDEITEYLEEGDEGEIFIDNTPFYAESGGQTDDEGFIESATGRASVLEVVKIKSDLFAHVVSIERGFFKKGDTVRLKVDKEKRRGVSRNHTATHLLHYALRQFWATTSSSRAPLLRRTDSDLISATSVPSMMPNWQK
jgi:alanyl-tRNA synthetase